MIIEFDENDVKSLTEVMARLHKIRTKLCRNDPTARLSNVRFDKRLVAIQKEYDAIKGIHQTDVRSIYESQSSDTGFYVYAHCNPDAVLNVKDNARHLFAAELGLKSQPFYIGKGFGSRCYDLNRNEGHRKIKHYLDSVGKEIQVIKIYEGLTEQEALAEESKLIDIFGLKALATIGLLTNLDEGLKPNERRSLYPKGVPWYLNRMKLKPYSVPKG